MLRRHKYGVVEQMSKRDRLEEGRTIPARPIPIKPGGGDEQAGRIVPTRPRPPKEPAPSKPKK